MNNLPCKDCITLPICLAIKNEMYDTNRTILIRIGLRKRLEERCSLLQNYTHDKPESNMPYQYRSITKCKRFYKFFNMGNEKEI